MKVGIAILSVMAGIWATWSLYAAHSGLRWRRDRRVCPHASDDETALCA